MTRVLIGFILGSRLAGPLVWAGTFYDQQGHPNAPSGSIQEFDYFRSRQQFLDLNAMRRNSDAQRADPCGRR